MPIKPENRAKYPKDWSAIAARVRARDGNRCKFCGVPNGAKGIRGPRGEFVQLATLADLEMTIAAGIHVIRIVLTCAHLHDMDPANCADDNLAALCQRCHNQHDLKFRQANAARTRKERKAAADLFGELTP